MDIFAQSYSFEDFCCKIRCNLYHKCFQVLSAVWIEFNIVTFSRSDLFLESLWKEYGNLQVVKVMQQKNTILVYFSTSSNIGIVTDTISDFYAKNFSIENRLKNPCKRVQYYFKKIRLHIECLRSLWFRKRDRFVRYWLINWNNIFSDQNMFLSSKDIICIRSYVSK